MTWQKTATWVVIATSRVLLVSWWVTGSFTVASGISGVDLVLRAVLYYGHEKLWASHLEQSSG